MPKLSDIIEIFVQNGFEVTVHPTQRFRDALDTVWYMDDDYDRLVISGGDGSLDEAVSGMMRRPEDKRIPIGYIPAGSTNDFASSLLIPRNPLEAAYTAVTGYPFPCDVGGFQQGFFIYIAAFGMFTDVSYDTPQELKNQLGHLAYLLEGVKRLSNIKSYQMKVVFDGNEVEGDFIYGMVTNSRSVGGVRNLVNKQRIVFDDGLFEVTLIKRPRNILELQEVASALMIQQLDSENMIYFKAKEIVFETEEDIPWTLDGEYGGDHSRTVVRNLNRAIRIMLPEDRLTKVSDSYGEPESRQQ